MQTGMVRRELVLATGAGVAATLAWSWGRRRSPLLLLDREVASHLEVGKSQEENIGH